MKSESILKTYKGFDRPVIPVDIGKSDKVLGLIDTGALFPVWVSDERILIRNGARLIKRGIKFGGFGQGDAVGNLYELPYLQVGNLIYPNINIVACEKKFRYSIIISATMFRNLIYEIDNKNSTFKITVPDGQSNIINIVIQDSKGRAHILCTGENRRDKCKHTRKSENKIDKCKYTCKGRVKQKGKYVAYIIEDKVSGEQRKFKAGYLKAQVRNGLKVDNLTLTSDGRLVLNK